jgi:hypothetical protein
VLGKKDDYDTKWINGNNKALNFQNSSNNNKTLEKFEEYEFHLIDPKTDKKSWKGGKNTYI